MGSSAASATCLKAILREPALDVVGVVTQPDRPAGRGKALTPCACKAFAVAHGITEIITPENVNSDEAMERIRAWRPDAVAVVAFGQFLKKPLLELPLFGCVNCHFSLLPKYRGASPVVAFGQSLTKPLLDLPPHGCVNCHFSLLPKYRGAAPVIAALEAGDRKTGVTVMHMGVGLDDGPIMLQSYEPIYPDTTGGMLMNDLATAGGVALAKALRLMAAGALPPEVPQDEKYATYVKKLRKTDGHIVWDSPVIEIERRIRAYNPWPGCFTFLPERFRKPGNAGRLVVIRSRIVKAMEPGWAEAPAGTILKLDKDGPVVKCHDTALQLLEVKPEGSSAMDGGAFLRGRALKPMEDFL